MKQFNTQSKAFENFTEDLTEKKLMDQLRKDKVPYSYSEKSGVVIEDKDLISANNSKDKVAL